jgi:hypothetical protein
MKLVAPRRRLTTLAIVLLLLCVSNGLGPATATVSAVPNSVQQVYRPGAPNDVPSTPVADYVGEMLALQAVDVGSTAAEPTLGVDKDGTAFFAASTLVVDTAVVYGVSKTDVRRSTDGGLSWSSVQVKAPVVNESIPPGNADPFVWVDQDTGRVFNFDLTGACNWLNFSDDKGATWTTNPLACGNIPVDHQTIGAGKPRAPLTTVGYPNVLYWCSNRVADATCGRSLDGGLTWHPTGTPSYLGYDQAAGGLCGGLHGHLETDPDGRLFVPKGHCSKPWISISEDNGTTWKRVKVSDISTAQTHTSVASDSAGNLYYAWFDATKKLPYLAISKDHGTTWGTPMMIAPPGVTESNFPVVSAGGPGRVAVSFPSSTDADRAGATRPWDQTVVMSTNALDADPIFLSATANDPSDPIHRGNCNGRCGGMWDFIDLVIARSGELWGSASDDCITTCITGTAAAQKVGRGIAIRQIGGPPLR